MQLQQKISKNTKIYSDFCSNWCTLSVILCLCFEMLKVLSGLSVTEMECHSREKMNWLVQSSVCRVCVRQKYLKYS